MFPRSEKVQSVLGTAREEFGLQHEEAVEGAVGDEALEGGWALNTRARFRV